MLEPSPRLIKLFEGKQKPLLMAHRGNRDLFPENTIAAFSQAFIDGADILETDLHLSADGEFICIHDETVDRTTNGVGRVKEMTLKDLRSLRTRNPDSSLTDHQIPILDEASKLIPIDAMLALELKTDRFLEPEVCLQMGSILRKNNILDRTIALSFSLSRLMTLKISIPEIPVGWISMTRLLPDKPVDLIGAFWPIFYLNPWYVEAAHRKKIFVCPLDPTPDSRLKFYLRKNVDAVLSNDPGKTRKLLDNLKPGPLN